MFFSEKSFSTQGMGQLANQAQHKARGIIAAQRASTKATGNKANVPMVERVGCPAKITISRNSFDYWISVENEFSKIGRIELPVKSHRKLKDALRNNWELNPVCEFYKDRNGRFYARVFAQKEVKKAEPLADCLGVDVGYRNSVARSDGYIGVNTANIIRMSRAQNAERRRQGHLTKSTKTFLKQLLDIEAHRAVNVSKLRGLSLITESPKILANLRSGKLQGWARCYFHTRCETLGLENEVYVRWINPAYSSQECSKCGKIDSENRVKQTFKCVSCGNTAHADINAARVIARRGAVSIEKMRSGTVNGSAA